jgi:hypothetical protein
MKRNQTHLDLEATLKANFSSEVTTFLLVSRQQYPR